MIITTVNNEEKIKYEPTILKINEKNHIKIINLEKRGNNFCDVIFNNCGKEIFVGRYETETQNVKVLYNDGRILVYSDEFIDSEKKVEITNIHTLYDIVDDICFSMKQEDLLNLFDPSLNTSYLKKANKIINYSDVEKRRRLRKQITK